MNGAKQYQGSANSVETLMGAESQNVNILYQQPQLIPIIEHLIQQEQQKQQQQQQLGSTFSQRSFGPSPIEIETIEQPERESRRDSSSQIFTVQAIPEFNNFIVDNNNRRANTFVKRRK